MNFCGNCNKLLNIDINIIKNVCPVCFKQYPIKPEDTLIFEEVINEKNDETTDNVIPEIMNHFVETSANDITNLKVDKPCPNCDMPYLTAIRPTKNLQIMYTCKCGYQS